MSKIHNPKSLIDLQGNTDLSRAELRNIAAYVIANERKNPNTKYLEVGVFGGGCIRFLKEHTKTTQFTGVDLFEDFTLITDTNNTHESGTYKRDDVQVFLGDRVNLIKGSSVDILPTMTEKFDYIQIDADHSYKATKKDFELCEKLLAPGGQIGFHNCSAHWDGDWHYVCSSGGSWAVCQELIQSKEWQLLVDVDRLKVFSKI